MIMRVLVLSYHSTSSGYTSVFYSKNPQISQQLIANLIL